MRANAELLVIGPPTLGRAVARALPRCRSTSTDDLLNGLWTIGHRAYDGVLVSYALGPRVSTALRSLREVAPTARIIVACAPEQEPEARATLAAGADDYVLEPVARAELESAFELAPVPGPTVHGNGTPSLVEVALFSEVLRNLQEGPQATLDRLAGVLQTAFDAEGVALHVDELSATAGRAAAPVLEEPIKRQDALVGSIALGRRAHGSYAASEAARLRDYAHLIETVVAQVREREHWRDLAWRDDLTGLRNRRYLEATLDRLLEQAAEQRLRLTFLLFDIDDFKSYNDRYGHETGDALLREVAQLLTHCSRERDVVARYGGDEFAIVLWDAEKPRVPGSKHPTDPLALVERFRRAIDTHRFRCLGPDAPGRARLSGGLACFPWDGKTRDELFRAADEALLSAKRGGKNQIVLAEGTLGRNGGGDAMPADEAGPADGPAD